MLGYLGIIREEQLSVPQGRVEICTLGHCLPLGDCVLSPVLHPEAITCVLSYSSGLKRLGEDEKREMRGTGLGISLISPWGRRIRGMRVMAYMVE